MTDIFPKLVKHEEKLTLAKELVDSSPDYVDYITETMKANLLIEKGVDKVFWADPIFVPSLNLYEYKAYGYSIEYYASEEDK